MINNIKESLCVILAIFLLYFLIIVFNNSIDAGINYHCKRVLYQSVIHDNTITVVLRIDIIPSHYILIAFRK